MIKPATDPPGEHPLLSDEDGWHSRGYLPHFDRPGLVQMLTFRLADAMPAERRAERQHMLHLTDDLKRRARIEAYLDAGHGSCSLNDSRVARLVEEALLHFDGTRYRLLAWVMMPNHAHALIETAAAHPVRDVVQSWKSFTSKQANRLLGRDGAFWQPDYFDTYVRNAAHYERAIWYIHHNPVKAGLVQRAEDWPFSSARRTVDTE